MSRSTDTQMYTILKYLRQNDEVYENSKYTSDTARNHETESLAVRGRAVLLAYAYLLK